MKKTIFAVSGLMLLTLFIIVTVNAQSNDPKASKANTEIKKDASDNAAISICQGLSGSKMANCCGGRYSTMKCDAAKCKDGKCDPSACKGSNCDQVTCKGGTCDQSACNANCRSTSSGMRGGPMNCNRDVAIASK